MVFRRTLRHQPLRTGPLIVNWTNGLVKTVSITEITTEFTIRARVADTFLTRLVGLLTSPPPKPGEGLLLERCSAVHMFFMRYALDVVFLDGSNRIVGIESELGPFRISRSYPSAKRALEVAARGAEKLREGMNLKICEIAE